MRVLLTGAAGFVGSHVLRHLLTQTDYEIVCPVSFRHKGLPARLASAVCDQDWQDRVTIVHWDMRSPADPLTLHEFDGCDVIMNVASESHVDRSISDPVMFVQNNVALMLNVLEVARAIKPRLLLQMSTDEVYGPAYGGYAHKEWDPVIPSNPYAASKAAQDAIAVSYWRTFGVPTMITRTMNLVSPAQDAEKFVPSTIRKILRGETVRVHASPDGVPGSRHWIDAREFAGAWQFLVDNAPLQMYPEHTLPTMYHIVGEERSNLEVAQMIARVLGKPLDYELTSFHASRPGHDLRYALDGTKLTDFGWTPRRSLDESFQDIVEWYLKNSSWLEGKWRPGPACPPRPVKSSGTSQ